MCPSMSREPCSRGPTQPATTVGHEPLATVFQAFLCKSCRGVAQPGSAPALGAQSSTRTTPPQDGHRSLATIKSSEARKPINQLFVQELIAEGEGGQALD